jgi:hypothetical protein
MTYKTYRHLLLCEIDQRSLILLFLSQQNKYFNRGVGTRGSGKTKKSHTKCVQCIFDSLIIDFISVKFVFYIYNETYIFVQILACKKLLFALKKLRLVQNFVKKKNNNHNSITSIIKLTLRVYK